jgi:hypothetical protein
VCDISARFYFVKKMFRKAVNNMRFGKVLLNIVGFRCQSKMAKTSQLKQMINSPDLEFIMEAHSGLSARIVEESGKTQFI